MGTCVDEMEKASSRIVKRHRIVSWYDRERELRQLFRVMVKNQNGNGQQR